MKKKTKTVVFSRDSRPSVSTIIIIFVLLAATTGISTPLTDEDIDGAIEALRKSNYSLFGNAIATSDLRFHLISGEYASFTLLSPRDGDVYRLGMSSPSAGAFVRTLRYHVLQCRLSAADLRRLPPGECRTRSLLLLPHCFGGGPLIRRASPNGTQSFTADGVRISSPNIYLGRRIAVHGLDGILSLDIGSLGESPCHLGLRSKECVHSVSHGEGYVDASREKHISRRKEKRKPILGHGDDRTNSQDDNSKSTHFFKYSRDFTHSVDTEQKMGRSKIDDSYFL